MRCVPYIKCLWQRATAAGQLQFCKFLCSFYFLFYLQVFAIFMFWKFWETIVAIINKGLSQKAWSYIMPTGVRGKFFWPKDSFAGKRFHKSISINCFECHDIFNYLNLAHLWVVLWFAWLKSNSPVYWLFCLLSSVVLFAAGKEKKDFYDSLLFVRLLIDFNVVLVSRKAGVATDHKFSVWNFCKPLILISSLQE